MAAGLVDTGTWQVRSRVRLALDADAPAYVILDRFREAAAAVEPPGGVGWGIAMPDPFDYDRGIGEFTGVGKFAALRGVDVRTGLGLPAVFLNDADAFVLGEWQAGVAAGSARTAGLTLGTGVGSGWLVDGRVADPGDPPGGRLHRVRVDGVPLEELVSRRAIRAAYAQAAPVAADHPDVREITERARGGEAVARDVLDTAFAALGRVLGPRLAAFGADLLVIGGSMAASWDLLGPSVERGAGGALPPVRTARDSDSAPLVGAALHAARAGGQGTGQGAEVATRQ